MEVKSPVGARHIDGEIESELKEAHKKIIMNESRLDLMRDLLSSGLCTRDIYSFACSQADLCTTVLDPDRSTITSAMRTKIRDLKQTLKINHRNRRQLEEELHNQIGGRSWLTRKKIKNIKNELRKDQDQIRKKHLNKINHYRQTMWK